MYELKLFIKKGPAKRGSFVFEYKKLQKENFEFFLYPGGYLFAELFPQDILS